MVTLSRSVFYAGLLVYFVFCKKALARSSPPVLQILTSTHSKTTSFWQQTVYNRHAQSGMTIPFNYHASTGRYNLEQMTKIKFYILFYERQYQFLCQFIWDKTSLKQDNSSLLKYLKFEHESHANIWCNNIIDILKFLSISFDLGQSLSSLDFIQEKSFNAE